MANAVAERNLVRGSMSSNHLVLFDLPLHPELLEQRIGRLDRIGQTEDIHVHIPFLSNSPQHALVRWYHEGLNAFEKNLEGGNEIFKLFSERLLQVSMSNTTDVSHADLESLVSETAVFHKELQQQLASGRDRLLEMNSFRPAVAAKLIKQIQATDQDKASKSISPKCLNALM